MDGTQLLVLAGSALLLVLAVANVVLVVRKVVRDGRAERGSGQGPKPATAPPPTPRPVPEPTPERIEEAPPPAPPVAGEPEAQEVHAPAVPPPQPMAPVPPTHPAAQQGSGATEEPAPIEPTYTPVSSVELRFEDGQKRIGVTPGTPTHDAFTQIADRLLADLDSARSDGEAAG